MSDQLLPILQRNRPLWQGQTAHLYADRQAKPVPTRALHPVHMGESSPFAQTIQLEASQHIGPRQGVGVGAFEVEGVAESGE